MRIDGLWRELEQEARAGADAAWLTRCALPEPSMQLLVGVETANHRRALLLPLAGVAIPHRREWPSCAGLEIFGASLNGEAHLGVRLIDVSGADVFAALAEDVARRVSAAATPHDAALAMLSRLRRWQKFLAAGTGGLSIERQRGLFGELHVLGEHLVPCFGEAVAIAGWRSPKRSHQDFQFARCALEVKTTVAKQPVSVRITSERQLDVTGTEALFLLIVVLDEREVDGSPGAGGRSLPEQIHRLRAALPAAMLEAFDDRLLDYGFLEADATRYECRRFTRRHEHAFLVSGEFPRLTEADLPVGVGDVSYKLSLSACEPFAVSIEQLLAAIRVTAQ